jgi:hypothetical protein
MGILPEKCSTTDKEIPADSGRPGPGDMTIPEGFHEIRSDMEAASFRTTLTEAPIWPRY